MIKRKNALLLVSLFVVLCGCSTETATKKVKPVDQERAYYLEETKPYIDDMLSEFDLIYNENYRFAVEEITENFFAEVVPNLEASDRRYKELRNKSITEPMPTKGLRESHKEKIDVFKKNFILTCNERAKASNLLLKDITGLGDDYTVYDLTDSLDASLKLIIDGNDYFYIGMAELFAIEEELNIKTDKDEYDVAE